MDETPQFDLSTTPLEGTNLIEAGAGTGKTYAITALFLRLLIEKNLPADAILVVTFTEAATEELKARIREKIKDALAVFSGKAHGDRFLDQLKEKIQDADAAARSLKAALLAFDQAAIHTIHGFCWKLLRAHAFESGNPFETDLITDQETLKKEIVADFWRIHFYGASPLFIHYAFQRGFRLSELISLVNAGLSHVDLRVTPRIEMPDTSQEEAAYKEAFEAACALWPTARSEIETLLTTYDGLHKGKYPPTKIPDWIRDMDGYMAAHWTRAQWAESFFKFTQSELAAATKKDQEVPEHPYFEACEQLKRCQDGLLKAYDTRLAALKGLLFDYVREELSKRKAAKNTLSFDDLLLRVDRALGSPKGGGLKRAVRSAKNTADKSAKNTADKSAKNTADESAFKAALIDEFQDTDPVQYRIFNTLFATGHHILFLVGDAKQAIYGFRGADIFAYMDAARAVGSRYTLNENWRSEPGLIEATNTVFSSKNSPFLFDDIRFVQATPAEKARDEFTLDGGSPAPFQLWMCDPSLAGDGKKTIPKGEAREVIVASVAGAITRLVAAGRSGRALLGETPVAERDIAVLVRRNKDARMIQAALSALNINSVLYTHANLFDSREALEMEQLMAALADPNDQARVRTALSTDMLGLSGEDLDRLKDADDEWEAWLVKFRNHHDLWATKGFIWMLRRLIRDEGILTRLIGYADGERRATNLRHLSEVLHQTEREKRLRMHGLLKWLKEARAPDTPRADTHQLRLESDEDPVKIVTIHKSKGLEYPIIFCPFLWDGARLKNHKRPFLFHDEAQGRQATLELGSDQAEAHRRLAEKEQMAENLRLLYVALTRAKNQCTMVWGRFNQSDTAAPAYLFHAPECAGEADLVDAVSLAVMDKDEAAFRDDVADLARRAGNTITVDSLPAPETRVLEDVHKTAGDLWAREFNGRIDDEWRVSSFSSLSSAGEASPWTADRDMLDESPEEAPVETRAASQAEDPFSIFTFPKGARAGLCLHEMFEHLDFTRPQMTQTAPLVAQKLDEYGFDRAWTPSLCEMIHRVLTVPLVPQDPGFTLSRVHTTDRLNEMEFTFPLKRITPGTLSRIFREHGKGAIPDPPAQWIDRLAFSPVKGFMRGFMDLVFQFEGRFYLVDWKSNFLGVGSTAYDQGALTEAMNAHAYVLQYHLYALALDRYLGLRLAGYDYETHFGAIYYIFLRGVDPEQDPSRGIYRDRPDARLIHALGANLMDEA